MIAVAVFWDLGVADGQAASIVSLKLNRVQKMPKIGAQLVSNADSDNLIASRALASALDRVKMAESKQSQISYSSLLITMESIKV